MKLESFGRVLGFAAELEASDTVFYEALVNNPACASHKALFEELAKEKKKSEKNILRARQENVTEMILEPIADFDGDSFTLNYEGPDSLSAEDALQRAMENETVGETFYNQASEKIKALSEVARLMKKMAKKRASIKERLEG
jgi:rubrerythrin